MLSTPDAVLRPKQLQARNEAIETVTRDHILIELIGSDAVNAKAKELFRLISPIAQTMDEPWNAAKQAVEGRALEVSAQLDTLIRAELGTEATRAAKNKGLAPYVEPEKFVQEAALDTVSGHTRNHFMG
jgi:hypothetical protein